MKDFCFCGHKSLFSNCSATHFEMIRNWIFLSRTWLRIVDCWVIWFKLRWLFLPLKVFVSACDLYQSYFSRFCENLKPFQWLQSLKDNGKRDVIPIFQDIFSHIVVPYQRWWFNMNNPNDGVYFSKFLFTECTIIISKWSLRELKRRRNLNTSTAFDFPISYLNCVERIFKVKFYCLF